jgi:inorganic phosphate transporter, PiT family
MSFWEAVATLPTHGVILLGIALIVALGFEFINGFHDTANAVTTVIYTRSLKPTPAVLYSGFLNFLGVLLGGTGVAFGIVNLLPVDLLVETGSSNASLVMVLAILLAGVTWNLATWYLGIPVSSSHTLIGAILGVGIANSLLNHHGLHGVNWHKAGEVGLSLLLSPVLGFALAAFFLLLLKRLLRDPRLYTPPQGDDKPPRWVRWSLIGTCGAVSFGHGSNDGQKGMGLILLVLIGFLPFHYALDVFEEGEGPRTLAAAHTIRDELTNAGKEITPDLAAYFDRIDHDLTGVTDVKEVKEVPEGRRWRLRKALFEVVAAAEDRTLPDDVRDRLNGPCKDIRGVLEFVPLWVVVSVALALGVGTTVGYKRIMVTVAEKIGKSHLTYAQGAVAEIVTAATIQLADQLHMPVSTTQVLSSGVAGTMAANKSGVQGSTVTKIMLAWVMTLPASMLLGGGLFVVGRWLVG